MTWFFVEFFYYDSVYCINNYTFYLLIFRKCVGGLVVDRLSSPSRWTEAPLLWDIKPNRYYNAIITNIKFIILVSSVFLPLLLESARVNGEWWVEKKKKKLSFWYAQLIWFRRILCYAYRVLGVQCKVNVPRISIHFFKPQYDRNKLTAEIVFRRRYRVSARRKRENNTYLYYNTFLEVDILWN